MAFKKKDKFLIIDADSEVYGSAFGCQRKTHYAIVDGKILKQFDNKNKYNAWFKTLDTEVQESIVYDLTEELLPLSYAYNSVDKWVKGLKDLACADRVVLLLTKGGNCFRTHLATIRKYKGNRDGMVKPEYYPHIRKYMINKYKAKVYYKWEADDTCCMSMEKASLKPNTKAILAALDKDLEQQVGLHVNPKKKDEGIYHVSELEGWCAFYCQMIEGDVADNIPGIKGMGKKSPVVKALHEATTVEDLCKLVAVTYEQHYGEAYEYVPWWWDEQYCKGGKHEHDVLAKAKQKKYKGKTRTVSWVVIFREVANLLYMLRSPDDQYTPQVKLGNWTPYTKGTVKQFLGDK